MSAKSFVKFSSVFLLVFCLSGFASGFAQTDPDPGKKEKTKKEKAEKPPKEEKAEKPPKEKKAKKEKAPEEDPSTTSSREPAPAPAKSGGGGNPPKSIPIKGTPAKIIQTGNMYYDLQNYFEASRHYREALNKEPNNFVATYKTARAERQLHNYEEAIRFYESAIALDPKAIDTLLFELGTSYRMVDRQNDAKEVLKKFLKEHEAYKDEYTKRAKLEVEGTEMVLTQKQKVPDYTVTPVNFNTAAGDLHPSILNQTEADSFVVFTSYRAESVGNREFSGIQEADYSDLFMAKIEDDTTFGIPENLGKRVNTKYNDGSSTFTTDGLTMYYTVCNKSKLGFGCVIYQSTYNPDKKAWGKGVIVESLQGEREVVVDTKGKTKKVSTIDIQPSLSPDGNTMYFVSDREGGWGKFDIWFTTKEGEGWSEPVNAGPTINTPFDDRSPFQSRSHNYFYFSTDGMKGYGGSDIFRIEGSAGAWKEKTLMNMGSPINSSYDDFASVWYKSDSIALFTSNRKGGEGRADIYYAKRKAADPVTVALHGVVRDQKTRQPVPFAIVMLFEIEEGNPEVLIPIDTFITDQSATYNFELQPNKRYRVIANAPEYLANEENLNTIGLTPGHHDIERNIDIFVERIIIGKQIVLNHIYYDYDKADLRPESKAELDNLLKTMNMNQQITILVGSHTDSNGSEKYNKELSERRAKSVMLYLLEQGVPADRVAWYGYGESELAIYPELSDMDEQLNRRSEFRITSFEYTPQPQ